MEEVLSALQGNNEAKTAIHQAFDRSVRRH
jgi:hypothetical protein